MPAPHDSTRFKEIPETNSSRTSTDTLDLSPFRVVVIGAGLTGLLLSHGLQKRGFEVVLYEGEASLEERSRDWTIGIHWALPSLAKILPDHLASELHTTYTDPEYPYGENEAPIPFYNGHTGTVAIHAPAIGMRRVSRTRLRRLLARDLDIRWGRAFRDVIAPETGPVTVRFADGSTASADIVVGADGSRSAVRRWLFEADEQEKGEVRPSEWVFANGLVKYDDADLARSLRAAHPLVSLAYTQDGLIFAAVHNMPDAQDPTTWTFHIVRAWKSPSGGMARGTQALAELQARPVNHALCEPFRSALMRAPGATASFATDRLHYWASMPWDNRGGRVTLAGDAAHSMLPSRGQGLNNAIKDIGNLLVHLEGVVKGGSAAEALREYEQEVVERGRKAVLESLEDAEDTARVQALHETRVFKQGLGR